MTFHFIGLGGIGMSALARILLQRGEKVQGSDLKTSELLQELGREGAKIQIGHQEAAIEAGTTIVFNTDIPPDNVELKKAKQLNLKIFHRSDLLDRLMENQQPLLVTGTHGKTTTTALLAATLIEANLDPTFVIGGILKSMNTNGRAGKGAYFVAEADESDGSFLKTPGFGAIVTNVDKEHLNYWKTKESLINGFYQFFKQVKTPSHLFWCKDDPILRSMNPPGFSYGFSWDADCVISNFLTLDNGIQFDITFQGKKYSDIQLSLFGRHNALNGAAVFCQAISLNVNENSIRQAFRTFSGTRRRLENIGSVQTIDIYDDYGHHPTEISCTLKALRERIRERRLVVLFQPHRYSRVQDLFDEFLKCFQEADELIITDIYSAGESPIEGVTSANLYTKLRDKLGAHVRFIPRAHLEITVANLLHPGDVVLTLGAGDITSAAKDLLNKVRQILPKMTVGVLFGGTSPEHEISILSARNIVQALDPAIYEVRIFGVTKDGTWIQGQDAFKKLEQKTRAQDHTPKISSSVLEELSKCQVCIPVFHGPQGEDGMIQGLLDALDLPYVGCDYRSSAICMNKAWTKHVAMIQGIPTAPFIELDRANWKRNPETFLHRVEKDFSYPLWVKPVHLGSSIGINRVNNFEGLKDCIEKAFLLDDYILIEKEIVGREIEFAVLGNEFIRVGAPGEILKHGQFYDYEKKYGSQAMGTQTPADLTELECQIGKELAKRMYSACGCKGLARVDFFLDANGHYWLNEINPMPGFTAISLYPKMWESNGLSQRNLCHELIGLALHRHRRLAEIRGKDCRG